MEVLGSVAAVIESQHGHGKDDVGAYETVNDLEFDHKFSCSKEEARTCWTIKEWMEVTNDPGDFVTYAQEHFIIDNNVAEVTAGEDDDSGYFSDGSLPSNEREEVTDDNFLCQLNYDTTNDSPFRLVGLGVMEQHGQQEEEPNIRNPHMFNLNHSFMAILFTELIAIV